jgi:hypothetical protein
MFIVICRADKIGRRKGPYVLATRTVFSTQAEADAYAATVNASRQPIVAEGRWAELRIPEGAPTFNDRRHPINAEQTGPERFKSQGGSRVISDEDAANRRPE